MYNPKHDIPLAVGLSLAVSLIATYVAAGNTLNSTRFADGARAAVLEVPMSIDTTATDSGIWFEGSGIVYDADGEFMVNLPHIQADENRLLSESGCQQDASHRPAAVL